jgi:hypothetical protein
MQRDESAVALGRAEAFIQFPPGGVDEPDIGVSLRRLARQHSREDVPRRLLGRRSGPDPVGDKRVDAPNQRFGVTERITA